VTVTAGALAHAPESAPPVEWSFNPWRERPGRAGVAAGVAVAMCVAVAALGIPMLVTLGLCLATLGALSPAFSPSRCRLDDAGAGRRGPFGWERRRWSEIRRAHAGRRAIVLSPYAHPHRLDAFRALVLPLPTRTAAPDPALLRGVIERHGPA
jgi:hypothetical protein